MGRYSPETIQHPDAPKPDEKVLADVARRQKEGRERPEGLRTKDGKDQSKVEAVYAMHIRPFVEALQFPKNQTAEQLLANPDAGRAAERIAGLIAKNSEFPIMRGWLLDEIRKQSDNEAFTNLIASKLK